MLALFRRPDWMAVAPAEEPPLRSELFSADQMEQHGKALAAAHLPGARRRRDPLLARLAENEAAAARGLRAADGGDPGAAPGHARPANGCSTTST